MSDAKYQSAKTVQLVRNDDTADVKLQQAAADYVNAKWYNQLFKRIRYEAVKRRFNKIYGKQEQK